MLDGKLFDVLEAMGRRIRHHDAPFGGIQLILSGDFCQLPPVARNEKDLRFAFEARSWKECVPNPVMLTKVFRQKDEAFASMLNRMRLGQIDDDIVAQFTALSREVQYDDGIEPTELYPRREQVEKANNARLEKLPGRLIEYESTDRGGVDSNGKSVHPETATKLLERLLAPPLLQLKIGAQVMLIRNLLQGVLVNGSVGKVIDFQPEGYASGSPTPDGQPRRRSRSASPKPDVPLYPVVRFSNGYTKLITPINFEIPNASGGLEALRCQVPLILSWGLSMHKSQGQTLERVKVNLNGIFECGQAYVAISRATKMESLQVIGFRKDKIRTHPRVLNWMESELGYGST
jgi:ATP-dependent DNA helicase PIF1